MNLEKEVKRKVKEALKLIKIDEIGLSPFRQPHTTQKNNWTFT
jgi:hypothetical protein